MRRSLARVAAVVPACLALLAAPASPASADDGAPAKTARPRIDPHSGLELVPLPGGTFHFGCEPQDTDCSDDERPGRTVSVEPMWMGKTEVTVSAYARCVADGACTAPASGGACNWTVAGREGHPVNCVDWPQAAAFCHYIGGTLPSAEEWEYAAKGGQGRIYPWGDAPVTDQRANFADAQYKKKYPRTFDIPGQDDGWVETAPVGSFPAGATPQGLLDMVGNVTEWTSSEFRPGEMEARGGGWATDTVSRRLRPSFRTGRARAFFHPTVGFRCRLPT
jgi:formylglycine-generating enzyme required for sulfatase activity